MPQAWLVAQPLVGPRRPEHLEPNREALSVELDRISTVVMRVSGDAAETLTTVVASQSMR